MCQGRSDVGVKVGPGSMCQSGSEVVSRSVGRSCSQSHGRRVSEVGLTLAAAGSVDLVLESNTLSNTGSGALI